MGKLERWITKVSRYRYFGFCISLLVVLLITGVYFANENRYKLEVMVEDFIGLNSVDPGQANQNKPPCMVLPTLIATFRDKPPSMFIYSQGRFSGPLRLVLEEAAANIGYAVKWQQEGLSASFSKLQSNTIDIIPHIRSKTTERERLYRYSEPLGRQKRSIYLALRHNEPKKINVLNDLKGMNVGYQEGNHFNDTFQNANHFNKKAYLTIELMVLAFNRQEIDVMVVSSKRPIEQGLTAIGARQVKYANYTIDDSPELYFLYSKNLTQKAVYIKLDAELVKMREQGVIEDIFRSFSFIPQKK